MAHRRCPPTPPSLYPRVQPSSPRSLLALTGLYSYVRPVVFPLEALAPVAAIRVARSYSRRLINLAGPRRISSVRVSSLDRRSALPPPTPLRARFDSPFRQRHSCFEVLAEATLAIVCLVCSLIERSRGWKIFRFSIRFLPSEIKIRGFVWDLVWIGKKGGEEGIGRFLKDEIMRIDDDRSDWNFKIVGIWYRFKKKKG